MKAIEEKRCARCQKTFTKGYGAKKNFCCIKCAKHYRKRSQNCRRFDTEGRIFPAKETIAKHYNTETDKCMACGVKCTTDRAHIIPYTEGGHALENLNLLCKSCHAESEKLPVEVYRDWISYKNTAYKNGIVNTFFDIDTKVALLMLNAIHSAKEGNDVLYASFIHDEFYSDYINTHRPDDTRSAEIELINSLVRTYIDNEYISLMTI